MTFIAITSFFYLVVYYSKEEMACKDFFVKNINLHNIYNFSVTWESKMSMVYFVHTH